MKLALHRKAQSTTGSAKCNAEHQVNPSNHLEQKMEKLGKCFFKDRNTLFLCLGGVI
jgi:hypothetical protein